MELTAAQNRQLRVFYHAFCWNPPRWRAIAKARNMKNIKYDEDLYVELLKIKLKKMGVRKKDMWRQIPCI